MTTCLAILSAVRLDAADPCNVTVSQVSAGGDHSLALRSDGAVFAWGRNDSGQLGDGTGAPALEPKVLTSIVGADDVSAGGYHSLVVVDGAVLGFGENGNGQLGNGTTADALAPMPVTGITTATRVAAGRHHSLALLADGTVRAWGLNDYGQLGNASNAQSTTPVTVSGLSGVVAIAAGGKHSLALLGDGTVRAWGRNVEGQLGWDFILDSNVPVTVVSAAGFGTTLTGVSAIAAGGEHSCAISNGEVFCWGDNGFGQVGDGTGVDKDTPVSTGLTGMALVAAGDAHSHAVQASGAKRVWSWGNNNHGQLGDHPSSPVCEGCFSKSPIELGPSIKNLDAISAGGGPGGGHTLAIRSTDQVKSWGFNGAGQLGDGSLRDSQNQRNVQLPNSLVVLSVGDDLELCNGDSTSLGVAWIYPGSLADYTFAWTPDDGSLDDPTSDSPLASPTTTTTYTLTVTQLGGDTCSASDSVTVTVDAPVADAGGDVTVCAGAGTVLGGAAPGSGGVGPYSYSWSPTTGLDDPTAAHPIAAPGATTAYTLTIMDADGCLATDEVTVTVSGTAGPIVNAGADLELCAGASIKIDATVSGGTGSYTYAWTPANGSLDDTTIQDPMASPAATTEYLLTVTDTGNACVSVDRVTVTVLPAVSADAGPDRTLCAGSQVILGPVPVPGDLGPITMTYLAGKKDLFYDYSLCPNGNNLGSCGGLLGFFWDDEGPAGFVPTEIHVELSRGFDGYGSPTDLVTRLNGVAGPSLETAGFVGCYDDPAGAAMLHYSGYAYAYVVGGSNEFRIEDQGSCFGLKNTGALPDFARVTVTYTAFGGVPPYTFKWDPETGLDDPTALNPVATPAVDTTYTLTVTDDNGCEASDDVKVTVSATEGPTADAGPDQLTCVGGELKLGGDPTESGGTGPYTCTWTPAAGLDDPSSCNPTATVTAAITYVVEVTDSNGCVSMDSVFIDIEPPIVADAGANDQICPGGSVVLGGAPTASGGAGGFSYLWEPADGLDDPTLPNPTATPTDHVTYTVTVTDASGCSASDSVHIQLVNNTPTVDVGADLLICDGASVQLGATVSGGKDPYSYEWSPSAGLSNPLDPNPMATPGGTQTYTLEVTDSKGCAGSDSLTITVGRAAATFVDVPLEHIFWPYVESIYGYGITSGCSLSPMKYCPDAAVSRAQMAVFITRALDVPLDAGATCFSDIALPYSPYICKIAALGITVGCGGGKYCPDAPITRQEMAIFLIRAMGITPDSGTSCFTDVSPASPYAPFICELADQGVTAGCALAPPAYCPTDATTRGQMAVFLVRAFGLGETVNCNLPPPGAGEKQLFPEGSMRWDGNAPINDVMADTPVYTERPAVSERRGNGRARGRNR